MPGSQSIILYMYTEDAKNFKKKTVKYCRGVQEMPGSPSIMSSPIFQPQAGPLDISRLVTNISMSK